MLINKSGFSLIEIIIAVAIFSIIMAGGLTGFIPVLNQNRQSNEIIQANRLAEEGLEAVRSIRNRDFNLLSAGNKGIGVSNNLWNFSGDSDVISKFTRQISLTAINPDAWLVKSLITWNYSFGDSKQFSLETILTNWKKTIVAIPGGGMLVYGDGGNSNDSIKYQLFNGTSWGVASSLADIDTATTNRYLRSIHLYSSSTRDEKIVISRHYDGTNQYIYSQVYNGTNWGNVQLLSSWKANTFLDVQNFDGTYLNNGDFMVVYSDNTNTPKFRTWNGSSWSTLTSVQVLSGIPVYITTRSRPNSNEVMLTIFNTNKDSQSEYFNGSSYLTSNWSSAFTHFNNAMVNTVRGVDFSWSSNNPNLGNIIYSNNSKKFYTNTFTANGSGGGAWETAVSVTQSQNGQAVGVASRPNSNQFIVCNQDGAASQNTICYLASTVPNISSIINPLIFTVNTKSVEKSFDLTFEKNGNNALIVYSDNTNIPKYKKYNATTNTWDASANTIINISGIAHTTRTISNHHTNDIMILIGDDALDMYSVVWDSTNHIFYTSGDKAMITHGINGSNSTDYWYDFIWN